MLIFKKYLAVGQEDKKTGSSGHRERAGKERVEKTIRQRPEDEERPEGRASTEH